MASLGRDNVDFHLKAVSQEMPQPSMPVMPSAPITKISLKTYLSQCWLRSMMPHGITRTQWVNYLLWWMFPVEMDPVEQFLERTAPASIRMASWCYPGGRSPKLSLATGSQTTASETSCFDSSRASSTGASCVVGPSQPAWSTRNRQCTSTQSKTVSGRRKRCRSKEDVLPSEEGKDEIKKKVTCGRCSQGMILSVRNGICGGGGGGGARIGEGASVSFHHYESMTAHGIGDIGQHWFRPWVVYADSFLGCITWPWLSGSSSKSVLNFLLF